MVPICTSPIDGKDALQSNRQLTAGSDVNAEAEHSNGPMLCLNDIIQKMNYDESMDVNLFDDLNLLSQTGNFTQAAKLANTSQPSFSRRIKALEEWVGVTLVDRSRQPVRLTAAGAQMLDAGLRSISILEEERSQIRLAQELPDRYVVTIGEQHSISWNFYTNWLKSVEDEFGSFPSRLRADDLPHCMGDLSNGEVDFVIAYADANSAFDANESMIIGQDQLIPVCSPDPDGRPIYQFTDDAAAVPYIRFTADAPISRHLEPIMSNYALESRLETVYENSMAGALLIQLREGGGVSWLPQSLLEADLINKSLVRTGSDDWIVPLDIRLHRNSKFSNHLTRSIWSFLKRRQD